MEKRQLALKRSSSYDKYLGFTLIECLLALLILSSICLLFSACIKNVAVVTKQLKSEREKEWHIFLIQLENELVNCYYEKTQTNKIVLKNKKNGNVVWIEYKLGKIVKVENGGYQPLLTEVKTATFNEEGKTIVIKVSFENNLNQTAKWIITQEHKHE
ncbi:prepilin-type N-terminal cleavage/methylation domain-containing protein [Enterococcus ureilyticus]|uniref:Prepilin-type N-terminal cleavage/methylation domain-containing protein n=1 Tax=Enterococcus ureilyticus TaxID=1131292 RepID=A0A1E5HAW3_9ENTE|nr:competence type IV pilus minor pilin ComGF [Enterococcus ureilyticus]MBM7688808.1 competence protein ComGF [Enterococcus ureilyticus]MBO0446500.1 ComGF family competence protein [Enterococcus ureilyticus]OEG22043.1 prepilin-type N-terminal cleavage/methylation domain-containing protein [Enterococcus ureilyticus]